MGFKVVASDGGPKWLLVRREGTKESPPGSHPWGGGDRVENEQSCALLATLAAPGGLRKASPCGRHGSIGPGVA